MLKKVSLLLLMLVLATGCVVRLDPLRTEFLNYSVSTVTPESLNVDFSFKVTNPNQIPIDINSYSMKIFINDKQLISEERKGFNLTSGETKLVIIPLTVRYDRVFDTVLSIFGRLLAGNMYLDYKVDGMINAGSFGMSVSAPIKASGKIEITKEMIVK